MLNTWKKGRGVFLLLSSPLHHFLEWRTPSPPNINGSKTRLKHLQRYKGLLNESRFDRYYIKLNSNKVLLGFMYRSQWFSLCNEGWLCNFKQYLHMWATTSNQQHSISPSEPRTSSSPNQLCSTKMPATTITTYYTTIVFIKQSSLP